MTTQDIGCGGEVRMSGGRRGADSSVAVLADLRTAELASVVNLVRTGHASTRPQLVSRSGLSVKVVAQRVESAISSGLIMDGTLAPSSGGRQPRTLVFNRDAGFVLAAYIGHTELVAGLLDLSGHLKFREHKAWSMPEGPEEAMRQLEPMLRAVMKRAGSDRPWGIAVGVPGPVDFATGQLVDPPMMPGWDGFSARSWLREKYDCPIWVDNHVHLMALAEWTTSAHPRQDMLFLEVATGVGAGLVFNGKLVRGNSGGSGFIGHLHVTDDPAAVCRCGKTGCLEAVASGWKLIEEAKEHAFESAGLAQVLASGAEITLADLGALGTGGDETVLRMIGQAAVPISEVVANLVNFTNPGVLVLGGGVLRTGPRFLEVLRRVVLERSTALARRDLEIRAATLDFDEVIIGAGLLAIEGVLDPVALSRWISVGSPLSRSAELQQLSAS